MTPTSVIYDSTRKMAYGGSASDSSRYSVSNGIITWVEGNISTIPAELSALPKTIRTHSIRQQQ